MSSLASEIERRITLYASNFRVSRGMDRAERDAVIRNHMIGHEMRLAFDTDGNKRAFETESEDVPNGCPKDGWRGIADYAEVIDDTLTVLDNKNRPAIFTNAEILEDEQLSGYLDFVRRDLGRTFSKYRQGIYYYEFGYTQVVDIDAEQIDINVARLKARADHLSTLTLETLVPEPGFGKCQYCDYLQSCDAGKTAMTGGGLTAMDAKQAKELASWVMVEEEKLKSAKTALKIFTGEFGPVELDDKTRVGHAISIDGVDYDKNLTLRIIKGLMDSGKIGGKLSDFTSLNLAAVKKLAKVKDADEALEPARSQKSNQKFEFFRPKSKRGVRTVKEGRKTVVKPEDKAPRKAKAKVKSGARR